MAKPTIDELDEFIIWWWGPDTDECTVSSAIEDGQMADIIMEALQRWGQSAGEGD